MTIKEQIEFVAGKQDYTLTDAEYLAVSDWINAEKDHIPEPRKEGLLKLINGEMNRRLSGKSRRQVDI
jgi:hypothetical protein